MSEYIKIVKRAMEKKKKLYPHLDLKEDEGTLLNDVYKEVWNLRVVLRIREPEHFKHYLTGSLPEEMEQILKDYINGSLTKQEVIEKIGKFIDIIENGAKELGYVYNEELGMFKKGSIHNIKKRRLSFFNFFF